MIPRTNESNSKSVVQQAEIVWFKIGLLSCACRIDMHTFTADELQWLYEDGGFMKCRVCKNPKGKAIFVSDSKHFLTAQHKSRAGKRACTPESTTCQSETRIAVVQLVRSIESTASQSAAELAVAQIPCTPESTVFHIAQITHCIVPAAKFVAATCGYLPSF